MRFPHPVAIACRSCGHPTVEAETSTGFVRVHCGTWRWQCDASVGTRVPISADQGPLDPPGDRLAA